MQTSTPLDSARRIEALSPNHRAVHALRLSRHGTLQETARDEVSFLTAYVVPAGGADVQATELRGFLRQTLPEHMVPSKFSKLDSLPLNANGKVDPQALPELSEDVVDAPSKATRPETEAEGVIAGIWAEVLQLKEVGVLTSFFDLGGNSLLLVQVHRRIREAFDTEIAMLDLFRATTVRALAELVTGTSLESNRQTASQRSTSRVSSRGRQRQARRRRLASRKG
ncbi:MAG: phosphopantetheine-binding protein [Acidobacteriota bacterium]